MSTLDLISSLLQRGRANEIRIAVQGALDEKISAKDILENALMSGMSIVGEKFKVNEVYVPEVLIAARAMKAGIEILKPFLASSGLESKGTVIIGTVKGDLHDIGKNLVKMMMEGKGLRVIDLGVDVSSEQFATAIKEHRPQIVCCSALLTTTMMEMKNILEKINNEGIRESVKVMIGGAPVTDSFCKAIGADLYRPDATSAADTALELCASLT